MSPDRGATLCAPDSEKSCFACCPPIRPAGYDHVRYARSLERTLRENTDGYHSAGHSIRPITGMSCWALGYLNGGYKKIGCLLHPSQNAGRDLRWRVEYGEKCRRETCWEARLFGRLDLPAQRFWLQLADGLNSFSYSSRRVNPLFQLLGWGSALLRGLAEHERTRAFSRRAFTREYPFFSTSLRPRAYAYLLQGIIPTGRWTDLRQPCFRERFERLADKWTKRTAGGASPPHAPYTHRLEMDPRFLAFLRLAAGRRRVEPETARHMKETLDRDLARFWGSGDGE